ncbi:hypothetical protein STANM309S_01191 [Streptomyces tanashiensis]
MQFGAERLPAREGAAQSGDAGEADGTVGGDPGHDLGVDEVASGAADFPDAFVGFLPAFAEVLQERGHQVPGRGSERDARPDGRVDGAEHLSVDVELELADGRVAESDGP